ncbi:hypothetical protein D3C83_39740 [compost metagenome]
MPGAGARGSEQPLEVVRHEPLYAAVHPQVLAQVEDQLEARRIVPVARVDLRP